MGWIKSDGRLKFIKFFYNFLFTSLICKNAKYCIAINHNEVLDYISMGVCKSKIKITEEEKLKYEKLEIEFEKDEENEEKYGELNEFNLELEKKYLPSDNSLYGGNFKYVYTKKTNEECNNNLYNLNSNKQLLFDDVNNWSNKYCNNKSNILLGSCRNINKECVDFVDKKFCDNYRMKWSSKTCHEPLDFVWSDPVKMVLPEYGNGNGTFVIFDKQIK
jgi:hypothetical protein